MPKALCLWIPVAGTIISSSVVFFVEFPWEQMVDRGVEQDAGLNDYYFTQQGSSHALMTEERIVCI